MNRGDIWFAEVGGKRRPVAVLTRDEVIDVRHRVTVAEVTTQRRGLHVEVSFEAGVHGLDDASVINCDGLHTITRRSLTQFVGALADDVMDDVCRAVAAAVGCSADW